MGRIRARGCAPHVDVVVVGFDEGKIAFEPISWDQASVLVQLGDSA